MKNRKTTLKFFDIMDYAKEGEYLSQMHEQGWKFAHVTFPGLYHFHKCEPEKVRYQLDYNKEGIKHKEEYVQMFADCGWEYLFDFVGYSYFRKPESKECADASDEEIFCDDESRYDMIMRIFKGRIIPLVIIFIACILPLCGTMICTMITEHSIPVILGIEVIIISALYISIFIRFTSKYMALKNRMGR